MKKQTFPEPTAGAPFFNKKGDIFLMKSYKWRDKYVIPGDHIELGENIRDAVVREIKEETGLNIYAIEFDKAFWKKKHFIFFDFACKTNSQRVELNSEDQEFVWVSPEDALRRFPIEPYFRQTIKKYLKRNNL